MERIGLTASEEMSFENVDGRRTDGRRMPVYTISSPVSLRLRWAKNVYPYKSSFTIGTKNVLRTKVFVSILS